MLPVPRSSASLPRARRTGPLSRPRQRGGPGRWRWSGLGWPTSPLLAPGNPFHDEARWLARRTPTGLTETELLASLNYLDHDALLAFDGIGPTLASNILAHRTRAQYFASLDELALVPKIGGKRFARIAGRPPETQRYRLHDLMRRSRRDDIRLSDLQPWTTPAPGIASIHVLALSDPAPAIPPGEKLLTIRLRRYAIHFLCTAPVSGGRAAFVHQALPEVLRFLLP
jgi:hypothetical protein